MESSSEILHTYTMNVNVNCELSTHPALSRRIKSIDSKLARVITIIYCVFRHLLYIDGYQNRICFAIQWKIVYQTNLDR